MPNKPVERTSQRVTMPLAQQGEARLRGDSTLAQLIQDTLDRHAYLKAEVSRLDSLFAKLSVIPCQRHGRMLQRLHRTFQNLKLDLQLHLHKEEAVLFPSILKMEQAAVETGIPAAAPFGSFSNGVRMMLREHDAAITALDEMREIANGYVYPEEAVEMMRVLLDGLNAFDTDLRFHVHLENDVLFLRAGQLARKGEVQCR